jgi:hypothetical protein
MTLRIFRRDIASSFCSANWGSPRKNKAEDDNWFLSKMKVPVKIRIALIAALALCAALGAQDRLADNLARFKNETDPVRKARALAKLGDDQVDLAKKQLKADDEVASLHTLEQYRDEVRATVAALKGTGVDAERKPAGFKELQISLRETIRRIDELILTLNVDKRPFFREVRNDLFMDQNELIDDLFPRRPDRNAPKSDP